MELRHLRYFVTVAEELHFGRAALRLNISQPPLSQQIHQLEQELGFPLLLRSKHHVELTEAGKVFLAEARLTLAHLEKASDAAARAHRGAIGRLAIGFVGSATYNIVPLLKQFRTDFPMVDLTLHQMKTASQLQALHDRRIQLGIVRTPIQSPLLAYEVIEREPFVAVLPCDHPLAGRAKLRIQDLSDEDFIVSSRSTGSIYRDAVLQHCIQSGYFPRIALEAPEVLTTVAFVSAGMGVALVPASFRNHQNNNVVYCELEEAELSLDVAFVWRKDEKSPVLREFLRLCMGH